MMYRRTYFLAVIPFLVTSTYAQQIFRSDSDSVKFRTIMLAIADSLEINPRADIDELTLGAESHIVKDIPLYKKDHYVFYDELLRSDRPDTIKDVGLFNLNIRKLPAEVFKCRNLIELDISGCRIKRLPKELNDLPLLEKLTITKSGLKKLKVNAVDNRSIKDLNLAFNKFKRIPKNISK